MIFFNKSVVSNKELQPLFSLGLIHISDFLKPEEDPKADPCELALAFDEESKLVQLTCQPDKMNMWGSMYWYRSGTNQFMKNALKDVVEKTMDCIPDLEEKPIFLDIASNDGTLLSFVGDTAYKIGVDCSNYPESSAHANLIIQDYFSAKTYKEHVSNLIPTSKDQSPYYVTCCAMFYDLDDPIGFLKDVYEVMHDEGIFVLQLSYTPLMLIQTELGNICHEHLCYYNLTSLKYVLDKSGFVARDVELNNTNGGSIRIYCQKDISNEKRFKTPADLEIAKVRVESILRWEECEGYNSPEKYLDFFKKIQSLKEKVTHFIRSERAEGKKVWGYGASTKGNTMLQYFGLKNDDIEYIAERQELKHGLRTIGTNIPICSEASMREEKPDYLLVLPWHFISEFKEREREYLASGGKFIVPCPKFEIVGCSDAIEGIYASTH